MLAFIAGLITFKCSYTQQTTPVATTQQGAYAAKRKDDESCNKAIALAAVISLVIYFGMYGLLENYQKRK